MKSVLGHDDDHTDGLCPWDAALGRRAWRDPLCGWDNRQGRGPCQWRHCHALEIVAIDRHFIVLGNRRTRPAAYTVQQRPSILCALMESYILCSSCRRRAAGRGPGVCLQGGGGLQHSLFISLMHPCRAIAITVRTLGQRAHSNVHTQTSRRSG